MGTASSARWGLVAVLAAIYYFAGTLALQHFTFLHASASPVWPPAGIALAALLLLGARIWPAILLGAVLVNLTTAGSLPIALGIGSGNTLEGLVGARLVARFAGGPRAFDRARDIFSFVLLAGLLSTTVSATIGVTTLMLGGHAAWPQYGPIWLTWWLGDAAGVVIVAPVVLLWSRHRGPGALARRPLEAALLLLAVLAAAEIGFGGMWPLATDGSRLTFLSIPPLVWAAFRFGPREVATAVMLLSGIAVWGTLRGAGPFVTGEANESLLLLQVFMATMAGTMLPVAALVWERKGAEADRAALLAREQSARAEAEEGRHVAEELARVARSFTESLDVSAIGERIVAAVLGLFTARAAAVRLLAPDGSLVGVAFAGGMKAAYPPRHVIPGGRASVSGLAVLAAAAVWSEDVFADPRLELAEDVGRGMAAAGDAAVLAVPLAVKGQIIGAVSIADRRGRRFTRAEAEMLQAFADQGAVAVDNARLYEQATRQRREAEVITALAAELNRSLDLDRVLRRLAEAARELCDGDIVRVALREPDGVTMTYRYLVGTRAEGYEALRLVPGQGFVGRVMQTGQPYRTADAAADPAVHPDYGGRFITVEGIRTAMVVPVRTEAGLEGLIYVARRTPQPFTDRDEAVGLRLADHAGIAIRNSQLFAAERAARGEAHAANRAKDHFLATLSHELRTPLNAMMGWLRMLRGGQLDAQRTAHALAVIDRNARLQAQLINDLLDVSRIIAGKLELEPYPIDLVPVVQEAIEAVRGDVEARALVLAVELDPAPGEIRGDPVRLQQVVMNLLSNAVKFTPRGGRIAVRLDRHDGHARLTVSDTGEGIEPHALAHIFAPFHQADSSSTRSHQGLGLGLAIVRQLVELHGGRVSAQSAGKGHGATFTVSLPSPAVRPRPAGPRERGERPPAGGGRAPARVDGLRVLVVDDHADARELIGLVLRERGAHVQEAGSVAEALEVVTRAPIDVLVSDLAMPGADGFDLIAAVRAIAEERGTSIRAVAVTAYAGGEVRERVAAAGFAAHVTKPVDPDDLVELIAALPAPPA